MSKHLLPLLQYIDVANSDKRNPLITQLMLDSRSVKTGTLFCAYPGTTQDGREFILQAKQNGAAAIVYETNDLSATALNHVTQCQQEIPCIPVENLAAKISALAAYFYDRPGDDLWIVGVTGTSGKTSCTYFIAQALDLLHQATAIIGTTGNGRLSALTETTQTTPNPIEVQRDLAEFKREHVQCVAIEASSHALDQYRVSAVPFRVAVFTNLSHEHLDYHKTLENYGLAKAKLFAWETLTHAIVNVDDAWAQRMLHNVKDNVVKIGYTLTGKTSELCDEIVAGKNFSPTATGFTGEILWRGKSYQIQSQLLGQFNFDNILATLCVLIARGIEVDQAISILSKLSPVPGRMQCLGDGIRTPLVVIDYAHKPAALEQVLQTLKAHCMGALWCIFGCGGDRDRRKRPIMADIAERYADKVIVTDDNPRHEDPQEIVQEIMAGFQHPENIVIEHDRLKAMRQAIQAATPQDIILIAGKGHENYQQIGDIKKPFDDAKLATELLA